MTCCRRSPISPAIPIRFPATSTAVRFANSCTTKAEGTVERPNPFLVFHQAVDRTPISAIRMGDFKLVKTWEQNRLELFDLSRDLSEVDDLSERMPEKTQELHALLTGYLEEVGADMPRGDGKGKNRKKKMKN